MPSAITDEGLKFNTIEETIEAFRNGEFIVVLDSQNRENEGDLIIAADAVTPAKMAFMIRYTSGYICAPILPELAASLDLPQMVTDNTDPNRTAYTISIDSNDPSVSTGISARDRSLTCRNLASPDVKPTDFRRPGHILPLRARPGGVRERNGHTEATIDFCRLAGKREVGVICELVEDGDEIAPNVAERTDCSMMRRDGCLRFGKRWGLKVCTIEDLVDYLERTEGSLPTLNGKH
ncbi:3,4-dihydroxy-2-butanone 4-phosphate synthase, putative [Coccidioides posadasii C735 delta SOWgp]|uniref:3,4-dihydroxy-2-butanone 4-phosphate synthase n=1 Tax=Coccidioides posadasii (strain C735) TaxID=222929 RepID=C5PFY7_COCP7|nr:3,4-dihydroxy-2-butanone 4-phosphate synthase, putative [Coccidioides posadasii C735 delta SOWgp]EER23440.1 3,4-dihydroxy-2-butanone 4-phosphate synthase, putative [Coccidioides posadasii C735 delta SOWgp]|eukprot:XP_003065585.1 3,4-dihydroxy-2-butanone 4-phosphate synthase, putative [Coccidioides posadasii C735 delta SOWgp]